MRTCGCLAVTPLFDISSLPVQVTCSDLPTNVKVHTPYASWLADKGVSESEVADELTVKVLLVGNTVVLPRVEVERCSNSSISSASSSTRTSSKNIEVDG